jgi:hypothetical protein
MEGGWYTGLWTQEGLYYWTYGHVLRWMGVGDAPLAMVESPTSVFRGGRDAPLLQHASPMPPPLARGLRVGRLASALFGLGTIVCVFLTLAYVTGDNRLLAALATASLMLVPEFGVRHAFVTNDTLVTLFASIAAALAIRWTPRRSWWYAAAIGVATGCAIATKLTAGVLVLLLPIVWWLKRPSLDAHGVERRELDRRRSRQGEPDRRDRRRSGRHLVAWAAGLVAAGAWPFVRNWLVFGDPLATTMKRQLIKLLGFQIVFEPGDGESYVRLARMLFRTFWASIGWAGFGPAATWVWTIYIAATVALLALVGVAMMTTTRGARTPRARGADETKREDAENGDALGGDAVDGDAGQARHAATLSAIVVVLHVLAMLTALALVPGNTARYLLPITVPLLVLATRGAQHLASIGRRLMPTVPMSWIGWACVAALAFAWLDTIRETARAFHVDF